MKLPGKEEIRRNYDRVARWYDWMEAVNELLGVRRLRRQLLRRACGEVLEVAVGTGKNLPYYPPGCELTAADLSDGMLRRAHRRARRLGRAVAWHRMDTEALAFGDRSFDTVVDTLSLCTYPNPVAALREMARVCRDDGTILLLEHGRSDRPWLGRWQDRRAEANARELGCQWNREPLALVEEAGLQVRSARRTFFGVFHLIEAAPAPPAQDA